MVELTYQGAHEHRPADQLDVDSFVGVKSPQAKGKRLSTFDVATVRFIEPERPEPEPEEAEEPIEGAEEAFTEEVEIEETTIEIEPESPALTPVEPIAPSSVPLEIERAKGDEEDLVDEPQLNLF